MDDDSKRSREELLSEIRRLRSELASLRDKEENGDYSRAFLNAVIDHVPGMIFIKDADELRFLLMNRAGEEITGLTRGELIGKNDYDFFPPDQADFFTEKDREVLEGGRLVDIPEEPIQTPQGERILHTKKIPLSLGPDGPHYLVGISEDITDRLRAEKALQKARDELELRVEERTRQLAEEKEVLGVTLRSIGEGVVVTDENLHVVLANQNFESVTGFQEREILKKHIFDVLQIRDAASKELKQLVESFQGGRADGWSRGELVRKNGSGVPVTWLISPILDHDWKQRGFVIVLRDMTMDQVREQELIRSQKLESLGVLAGGIAHDFNNLLAAIVGNISLAQLDLDQDGDHLEANASLKTAEEACLRARTLTEQLLTFSKGGEPLRKTQPITQVLREAESLSMRGSNVEFVMQDNSSGAFSDLDEGQMIQVFSNLFINAVQAMPNGGTLTVTVSRCCLEEANVPHCAPGPYLVIEVSDQGDGIPPEVLPKIFDPYFTTKETGNGLGLAAVHSIVRQHDGHIEFHSTVGEGTTARIFLPISYGAVEAAPARVSGDSARGRGTLLLLDDDPSIRESASKMVQALGYATISAASGEEAIEAFLSSRKSGRSIDAAILDLTIKAGMGGLEASKQLLQIDPELYLIVSSGYSTDPVMADHERYGFNDVLAKPYTLRDVSQVLTKLRESRQRATAQQMH